MDAELEADLEANLEAAIEMELKEIADGEMADSESEDQKNAGSAEQTSAAKAEDLAAVGDCACFRTRNHLRLHGGCNSFIGALNFRFSCHDFRIGKLLVFADHVAP